MRKAIPLIAAACFSAAHIANADDRTPAHGMPFCLDRDTLQEFMAAALKQDEAWLKQIKDCMIVKGGVRIGIIEDYDGSELGHVSKVRILGSDLVGYGLMLNLKK